MQRRTTTGLCVAAVLGLGVALGAQTTSTSTTTAGQRSDRTSAREINVSGCVARGADGQFTLTNARVEPMGSASSTTAGTTGTTTTGTTGATTTATEPTGSGTKANAATTWRLSGGSDLDKHVGHRVQITGRASGEKAMDTPSTSTTPSATTTADSKGPELEVQSIKMISTSCS